MPLFLYLEVGVINSISIFSPSFSLPISLTALLSFWTVCLRAPITRSPNPPTPSTCSLLRLCLSLWDTGTDNICRNLSSNPSTVCSFTSALFVLIFLSFYLFIHPSLPHWFKCAWSSHHWLFFTVLSPSLSRDGISAVRPTQDTHPHPPVAPPPMFHFSTPHTFRVERMRYHQFTSPFFSHLWSHVPR